MPSLVIIVYSRVSPGRPEDRFRLCDLLRSDLTLTLLVVCAVISRNNGILTLVSILLELVAVCSNLFISSNYFQLYT